jgi:hypothetical protein
MDGDAIIKKVQIVQKLFRMGALSPAYSSEDLSCLLCVWIEEQRHSVRGPAESNSFFFS